MTGEGSTWTNSGSLYIGYSGAGTLNIEAGGEVSNSYSCNLGYNLGSTGTATVTGADSTWTNSGNLYVGFEGTGTLNIEAGGLVSNSYATLGQYFGSTGTATVTGPGSTWTNSDHLSVGHYGAGTLTVTDGGLVSAGTLYASPSDLLGNGTITAHGAVLDTDLVFDSTHGLTQALPFGAGGTLNLNVDGTGGLGVGHKGTGTLRIADGLTVASTSGYLGYRSGSTGTATVTGAGSTWTNSDYLNVSRYGTGTLNIEAGGLVSNGSCDLGYHVGSTGTATVTGPGSTLTNSDHLYVGYYGAGTLNIEAGGLVSNGSCDLGYHVGSTGTATVTGADSTWTNSGYLYVGGTGTLNIEAGGQLAVGGMLKLWTADSTVTVNAGTLTAGTLAGSTGILRITDPAGGAALTVGSAASETFSGTLRDDTGPGSLTKTGTGTQTLAGGGIMYTGTTTVLEGMLKLSDTTAFASDILNSATTEFKATAGTWGFDEALGGAGTFVKSGDGTLIISGPQDYDAGAIFQVLSGTVDLNTNASGTGLMADADLLILVTGAVLNFGCNQHLDTLTIGDEGLVRFTGANVVVLKHLVMEGVDLGATTMTPEPATLCLLALGGLGVLLKRRMA